YGPHACDQWDDGEISLGRRLFRLLPEDSHDRQPLIGGGGRFVLAADLRLDNREDLESALDIAPGRAREMCDAAVLLAAWERWAEGCFDRLVGCYAFALWDADRRALMLARDPAGQRPLHYHRGGGFLAFASMPKGLHALDEVPRAPDEIQARDFLVLMHEHGSRTFFAGVERVEPGCFVSLTNGSLRSERHWPPARRPIRFGRGEDYVEAMREQLDRAVGAQLRGAGNEVGAHLSAGLDSSAVVTTAARLMAPSGGRVTAFTAVPRKGYEIPWKALWDEGSMAAATAALHTNIDHVLAHSTGRSPTEALDGDHYLFDRPLLNICNRDWTIEINRQARERGISILLIGQGGNLTLTYDGMDALPELLARGQLGSWLRLSRAVMRAGARGWRGVLYHSLGPWIPGRIWNWLQHWRGAHVMDLGRDTAINPARFSDIDYARRIRARGIDPYFRPTADTYAERMTIFGRVDSGNYYKGYLGGWGIDHRDPTVDRRLVEFCLNIPTEQFIAGGRPRSLARRALADRVPAAVLDEWRRGYQAADWHEAVTAGRTELADWIARLEDCPPAAATIDLARLRRMVDDLPTGGWETEEVVNPYRYALLRALSVGHFLHRASGSNR
ncbi:MAG TPA: asparagine synthase-related protein, partial [Caulobacteraceae bacterium]